MTLLRERKGMQPAEIVSGTGTFIFLIIVLAIVIGVAIMLTTEGKTLGCDVMRRIASKGLRFLIDPSAMGCQ